MSEQEVGLAVVVMAGWAFRETLLQWWRWLKRRAARARDPFGAAIVDLVDAHKRAIGARNTAPRRLGHLMKQLLGRAK